MVESRSRLWRRTGGMLVAAGLLALSGTALATNQSQQRQEGRDANQNAKQEGRSNKVDCRAANQQSNSQCRQDKRIRSRVAARKSETPSTDGERRSNARACQQRGMHRPPGHPSAERICLACTAMHWLFSLICVANRRRGRDPLPSPRFVSPFRTGAARHSLEAIADATQNDIRIMAIARDHAIPRHAPTSCA